MARMRQTSAIDQRKLFESHYEDDFLARTVGDLIRRPEVALGELVANAWDAGAAHVDVKIPVAHDEELSIEDDGCGLTKRQFDERWMTLGYNRQNKQGSDVEFPPERDGHRRAYGRNGQGRHGLLCFGDAYEVSTRRDGKRTIFNVRVASGEHPFVSELKSETESKGHGTRLAVVVKRNLPGADRIREILSSKFLHDPGFKVTVNGETLELAELPGYGGELHLTADDRASGRTVSMVLSVIESTPGRTKHQSGVAFWIAGRLVGEPGWTVMGEPIIDGRTRAGRRLTFIVQSDDLLDDVVADWTRLRDSSLTAEVGRVVRDAVRSKLHELLADRVRETAAEAINEHRDAMKTLGRGEQAEVASIVETIAKADPLVDPAVLSAAVSGAIEAKRSASVQSLLKRIEALSIDDVEGLHRLLDEWTIRDALTVLDEIGRRMKIVEAIEKLSHDKTVDELAVLHPLVVHARWLFGPEYDSPHYSFNLGLRNAVKKVFGIDTPKEAFKNSRRRPDLLMREDGSSLYAVGSEDVEEGTGLVTCRRVLLIELKKGGFTIGRQEMTQATDYVEDLLNCGHLTGEPFIHAFVVGHEVDPKTTSTRTVKNSRVDAQTFANLVATANIRLFRIRNEVQDRYPESTVDLLERFRTSPQQLDLLGSQKTTPRAEG